MKAVIYGVKSSPDEKESVDDQHRLIREAIEDEGGREVVGEPFGEDNRSGFRGERGPRLGAAMRAASDAASEDGEAELWVWHSSRLARGDGTKGRRSIQLIVAQLLYENVTVRSVVDPEMVTPMLVGIASTVSNKYSADLSAHTRRGLAKRKAAGKPVGPVPFGYMPEPVIGADGNPVINADGKPVTTGRRVVDSVNGPIVVWIFEQVVAGKSTGEIARRLNADGVRTQRGKGWIHRRVRELIDNAAYEGKRGYPAIVDGELARRARERLTRMDPAAVQQRKGGRPPSPAFVLRGVLFCACGAPTYCSQKSQPRAYVCREVVQCTGLCTRPRIPAQLIEGHVLRHLDAFVGKDLEAWIAERLATRTDEQAGLECTLDSRRSDLAALDRRRAQRMTELGTVGITKVGIEVIERIDAEREALSATIADIEARLSEFSTGPSSDAILDYYVSIRDAVTGRIVEAKGPNDVAAVLADVFEGIWAELTEPDFVPLTPDERSLKAHFVLRRPIDTLGWLPAGEPIRDDDPIAVPWGLKRDVLPPLPKPDARGFSTVAVRRGARCRCRRWLANGNEVVPDPNHSRGSEAVRWRYADGCLSQSVDWRQRRTRRPPLPSTSRYQSQIRIRPQP